MRFFTKTINKEALDIIHHAHLDDREWLLPDDIQQLPKPVTRWLEVSGAMGREKSKAICLKQKFKMKLKPEQKKWMHAGAWQLITTCPPAFIWSLKLKVAPMVFIIGRDKFVNGNGEMQMKLNNTINIGKNSGEKLNEGTLQRYLAETVWAPSAMTSPFITWNPLNSHNAEAKISFLNHTASGIFTFNDMGLFEKFSTMRYMGNDTEATRFKWIIKATDYKTFEEITIPSHLNITWMLDSGPWTWSYLEVDHIKYNDPHAFIAFSS